MHSGCDTIPRMLVARFASVLLFLVAFTGLLTAQVDTGSISGLVTDKTGAVVIGAGVVITQDDTGTRRAVTTNESGFFSATALRPGRYAVLVTKEGFRSARSTALEVRVQDRIEQNFELQIGVAIAEITVASAAPLLETDTSSLGQVIEEKSIRELPLNGRNFIQLATLGAGTLPSTRTVERDNFVSNGARPIQNSYLLDGVENKNRIMGFDKTSAQIIQPIIDSIQEFKVQTSTFSAEFGQAAGGVVNVTLKFGTNALHGSLFEFLRNSRLDATPYFQPAIGGKPQFIQNQFGATVGGPVIHDRAFFFGSWQSSREVNAAPQIGTVPTTAFANGNFGQTRIYDPRSTRPNPSGAGFVRDPFSNNTVPRDRWDPVAAKLIALYPTPNLPGTVRNFFYNPKERVSNDQYNARVDHRLSGRDSLFGRISWIGGENMIPAPLPDPANNFSIATPGSQSLALSETHIFSGTQVNEFRFGFIRTSIAQNLTVARRFSEFGINGTLENEKITGLPVFNINSFSALGSPGPGNLPIPASGGTNFPIEKSGRILQFIDNFSHVRNRHTFKAGVDIQQVQLFVHATNQARPNFTFNGVYTQNPQSRTGTGNALADFLLGYTSASTVSTQQLSTINQGVFQGFLQDDWNVNSKLTLNLGFRYELSQPWTEANDRQANFVRDAGPCNGQIVTVADRARCGLGRALVHTDYNNFAPRLGLAYQATPKTVIRSGFGVFHGRDENIGITRRLPNNPPFTATTQFTSDQINPGILLATGFPPGSVDPNAAVSPEVNSFPFDSPLPYVIQWNLNAEREIGGLVAQIGYTGSQAHKLYSVVNVNQAFPGAGAVNARRPLPNYSGIQQYGPFSNSNYHALLAKLERRFSNGASFLLSYTYGHSIDGGPSGNDMNDPGPQDARNLRGQRASSSFDVRQRIVFSGFWQIPGPKISGALGAIGRGWQLSGIAAAQTGQPFTVTLNSDPSSTGTTARPDRLRDGALPDDERNVQRWFDTTAFAVRNCVCFGNSGRNILRGPGLTNVDVGLSRTFAFRERFRLQFRSEAFNLLNHPNFGLPSSSIGAAGVGIIGSVVNPERQIQAALKLYF